MTNVDSLMVDSLQRHVMALEQHITELHTQLSESQAFIANEISASDRLLTITGLAIAIASIFMASYITWCQFRVTRNKKEVEKKEADLRKLRRDVVTTNKQINTDLTSLYKRLRKEETTTMLLRLIDVPEDVGNISCLLFSRELEDADYELLYKAYTKLSVESLEEYGSSYRQLFFQHFAGISIKDERLRNDFIDHFGEIISMCFRNDIIKSTGDIVSALKKMPPEVRTQFIYSFYSALKVSKFKDLYELIPQLQSVLTTEQWNTIVSQTNDGEEVGEEV